MATRSKYESRYKERTKLVKEDTRQKLNNERQKRSRDELMNARRNIETTTTATAKNNNKNKANNNNGNSVTNKNQSSQSGRPEDSASMKRTTRSRTLSKTQKSIDIVKNPKAAPAFIVQPTQLVASKASGGHRTGLPLPANNEKRPKAASIQKAPSPAKETRSKKTKQAAPPATNNNSSSILGCTRSRSANNSHPASNGVASKGVQPVQRGSAKSRTKDSKPTLNASLEVISSRKLRSARPQPQQSLSLIVEATRKPAAKKVAAEASAKPATSRVTAKSSTAASTRRNEVSEESKRKPRKPLREEEKKPVKKEDRKKLQKTTEKGTRKSKDGLRDEAKMSKSDVTAPSFAPPGFKFVPPSNVSSFNFNKQTTSAVAYTDMVIPSSGFYSSSRSLRSGKNAEDSLSDSPSPVPSATESKTPKCETPTSRKYSISIIPQQGSSPLGSAPRSKSKRNAKLEDPKVKRASITESIDQSAAKTSLSKTEILQQLFENSLGTSALPKDDTPVKRKFFKSRVTPARNNTEDDDGGDGGEFDDLGPSRKQIGLNKTIHVAPSSSSKDEVFKTPLPPSASASKNRRVSYSLEKILRDPKKCQMSSVLKNLSPDQRLQVLNVSPMIEMRRRKYSLTPNRSRLDLDEEEDGDAPVNNNNNNDNDNNDSSNKNDNKDSDHTVGSESNGNPEKSFCPSADSKNEDSEDARAAAAAAVCDGYKVTIENRCPTVEEKDEDDVEKDSMEVNNFNESETVENATTSNDNNKDDDRLADTPNDIMDDNVPDTSNDNNMADVISDNNVYDINDNDNIDQVVENNKDDDGDSESNRDDPADDVTNIDDDVNNIAKVSDDDNITEAPTKDKDGNVIGLLGNNNDDIVVNASNDVNSNYYKTDRPNNDDGDVVTEGDGSCDNDSYVAEAVVDMSRNNKDGKADELNDDNNNNNVGLLNNDDDKTNGDNNSICNDMIVSDVIPSTNDDDNNDDDDDVSDVNSDDKNAANLPTKNDGGDEGDDRMNSPNDNGDDGKGDNKNDNNNNNNNNNDDDGDDNNKNGDDNKDNGDDDSNGNVNDEGNGDNKSNNDKGDDDDGDDCQKSNSMLNVEEPMDVDVEMNRESGKHFESLMESQRVHLEELCSDWRSYLEKEVQHVPDEGQGEIRVSIGKAELLMKERFSQFQSLIEDHVTGRSAKEVTSQDLQGFWDMVLFQVDDVDAMFQKLQVMKGKNWIKEDKTTTAARNIDKKMPKKTTKAAAPSTKPTSKGPSKFAEFRDMMKKKKDTTAATDSAVAAVATDSSDAVIEKENKGAVVPVIDELKSFDGGFFKVDSPIKVTPGRKSLTSALLNRTSDKKKTPVPSKLAQVITSPNDTPPSSSPSLTSPASDDLATPTTERRIVVGAVGNYNTPYPSDVVECFDGNHNDHNYFGGVGPGAEMEHHSTRDSSTDRVNDGEQRTVDNVEVESNSQIAASSCLKKKAKNNLYSMEKTDRRKSRRKTVTFKALNLDDSPPPTTTTAAPETAAAAASLKATTSAAPQPTKTSPTKTSTVADRPLNTSPDLLSPFQKPTKLQFDEDDEGTDEVKDLITFTPTAVTPSRKRKSMSSAKADDVPTKSTRRSARLSRGVNVN